MRDLTWFETLEPKFREQGVDAKTMKELRQAWNQHAEKRDWEWWQKESQKYSTGQLEDDLKDSMEQLNAIGLLQWRHEQARGREM